MGDVGDLLDDFEPEDGAKSRKRDSAQLIRNGMKFAKNMRMQTEHNRRQPTWREQLKSYGAGKKAWSKRKGK